MRSISLKCLSPIGTVCLNSYLTEVEQRRM